MEAYWNEDKISLLAKHGKSFSFAGAILSKKQLDKAATLYQVCRILDDTVDELPKEQASTQIASFIQEIENSEINSKFQLSIKKIIEYGISRKILKELAIGVESDLEVSEIEDFSSYMVYCFRVAGSVGLMMNSVLEVKDQRASFPAIDLGIAMQCTNICRDILEDAQKGRTYLPKEDLKKVSLSQFDLSQKGKTPENLKKIVKKYLDLADCYYESALDGISYLPFRARCCVLVAQALYREIGVKIKESDYEVLCGRSFLTLKEKIITTLKIIPFLFTKRFWRPLGHNKDLHILLKGFPGVHE